MRIAVLSSEVAPFVGAGYLSELSIALPTALARLGHQVSVLTPLYATPQQTRLARSELELRLAVGDREEPLGFRGCRVGGVELVFVRHPGYYERAGLYADDSGAYVDNAERFAVFVQAALGYLRWAGWPDLIQLHGWQAALAPLYLRAAGSDGVPATVLALHKLDDQGRFETSRFHALGLTREYLSPEWLELHGRLNFLKGGLRGAGHVTVTSQRHARAALDNELCDGLEDTLEDCEGRLTGIMPGIDWEVWNPEHDRFLKAGFTPLDLIGKRSAKADLQSELGLERQLEAPLVAVCCRLVERNGLDLLAASLRTLLRRGAQLAIVATGERKYLELFDAEAGRAPGRVTLHSRPTPLLHHKLLAGADLLVDPAQQAPLGLDVLRAMRYGTLPVVRAVGVHDDVVKSGREGRAHANGFKFDRDSPQALEAELRDALQLYRSGPEQWGEWVARAMRIDNSWDRVARDHMRMYQELTGAEPPANG